MAKRILLRLVVPKAFKFYGIYAFLLSSTFLCLKFCAGKKKEKKKKMGLLGILLMGLLSVLSSVKGYYHGGGWSSGHATFYGGGDASGTMGMQQILEFQNLKSIFCFPI